MLTLGGSNGRTSRPRDEARGKVLLIEDLDALGSDLTDARRRAARIEAIGSRVTWVAVAPRGRTHLGRANAPEGGLMAHENAREKLSELVLAERWDHIVLASAADGGGPLARWLPRTARWWPSGFSTRSESAGLARMAARAFGERRLEPLDGAAAWGAAWLLGWSEIDAPGSRRPSLPLWDGDLVLALSGIASVSGGPMIEAFATLAENWSGVDLVAWSHPDPSIERQARASDIDMRIHHVGPAPRLAESSWLAQASAAILSSGPRISTALVLRALAAGCPLLWVAPAGHSAAVARWLEEQGCARVVPANPSAIADSLDEYLERGADIERMTERGRSLAESHGSRRLTDRVLAAVPAIPAARRAA